MFRNLKARLFVSSFSVVLTSLLAFPGSSAGQGQNPFLGSVPTGQAVGTALELSLKEAFDRALKYNLGLIESGQNTRAAHAVRLRRLSAMLPNLSARVSGTIEQINLKANGFNFSFPGVRIPTIVGPFGVADARAYLSQEVFNWSDIKNWKAAAESERASQYSHKSDRDLVVLTTANAYLLVIADEASVDSIRAQVKTGQTLYERDVDQNKAGVIASIDVLRARVELQTEQQRLIAAENQLAIDKLMLARVIGLPNGQAFHRRRNGYSASTTNSNAASVPNVSPPARPGVHGVHQAQTPYTTIDATLAMRNARNQSRRFGRKTPFSITTAFGSRPPCP